tara:strand:+ start:163 stop:282 length:120 start_codon:yes stop_codon:yes gene_type:complete
MVNNYNLEYELLRRSKVTDRAPKSTIDKPSTTTYSDSKK